MATPTTHFLDLKLTLFATVIGILIISGSGRETAGQPDANECGNVEGLGVLLVCQDFVGKLGPKVKPSSDCCEAVTEIGMTCVCKLITKAIEILISMEKVLFVAQSCSTPVQPGTACGNYTVPPI